ncbi:transposase [Streptomyces bluensis]|uniref:Mutator family transposase n=1 Tax=Streptomyces bluensis TaxID=33897 RepID=A0ABW6UL71_9ACTN
MLSVVNDDDTTANGSSSIDEIVRESTRRMLAAALEARVDAATGESERFSSAILSPWCRKSPTALVFHATREQRCRVHKTVNVLDAMPKSAQPGAKKAIHDICNAEDKQHAEAAIKTFAKLYGAKFPKAVKRVTDDQEQLPAFYDFPADHWILFKLVESAQQTWRAVNALHLAALVRAGVRFEGGRLIERLTERAA